MRFECEVQPKVVSNVEKHCFGKGGSERLRRKEEIFDRVTNLSAACVSAASLIASRLVVSGNGSE